MFFFFLKKSNNKASGAGLEGYGPKKLVSPTLPTTIPLRKLCVCVYVWSQEVAIRLQCSQEVVSCAREKKKSSKIARQGETENGMQAGGEGVAMPSVSTQSTLLKKKSISPSTWHIWIALLKNK